MFRTVYHEESLIYLICYDLVNLCIVQNHAWIWLTNPQRLFERPVILIISVNAHIFK